MRSALRWFAPESDVGSDERAAARVRRGLVEENAGLLRVVGGLSVPTITLYAYVLTACGTPVRNAVTWAVIALVGAIGPVWCATRPDPSERPRWVPMTVAALVVCGVGWGSFALVAMPPEPEYQAVVGVLLLGVMAANAVFSASVAANFWAFQISVFLTAGVGVLVHRPQVAGLILVVTAYAVPFGGLLARVNRVAHIKAVHFAAESERSVAELEVANRDLAHRATHDGLTGLLNRQAFTNVVEAALDASPPDLHVGLVFIDLDRFKVINDSLGHAVGDQVLRAVADRIAATCTEGEVLGRLGGDELTMLLPVVASVGEAQTRAEAVLAVLDVPFAAAGRSLRVGASIGVACSADGVGAATDLLRLADAALYQAKASGRGQVHGFDAHLRARLDRRLDEEEDLRQALDDGHIVAWYQPIFDVATGLVNGAEALARWEHRDGVRPAGHFIDMAIETGLDVDVSLTVARDLLVVREQVRAMGLDGNLGLNVPPTDIEAVGAALAPLPCLEGIAIEITENGVIGDSRAPRAALEDFRDRGATIWLDDFGRGDSALALLVDLPLDGVKIDSGFTSKLLVDPTTRSIVAAISRLAHELGLWVVAEGVETEEQLAAVRDLGIGWAQGFLLARPMPAPDLLAFFGSTRRSGGATSTPSGASLPTLDVLTSTPHTS